MVTVASAGAAFIINYMQEQAQEEAPDYGFEQVKVCDEWQNNYICNPNCIGTDLRCSVRCPESYEIPPAVGGGPVYECIRYHYEWLKQEKN